MLRGQRTLEDRESVVVSLLWGNILTLSMRHSDISDCLVLVGERKLRKEPMLRSFCFRNEPIRPLRIDGLSLIGDSSLESGIVELATGEDGPGVSQLGALFSLCLAEQGGEGLDNVSIAKQR